MHPSVDDDSSAQGSYRPVPEKVKSSTALKPARPYSIPSERVEPLPFTVRLADSAQDIRRAVESRSAAYARHIPRLGEVLRTPESDDLSSDVVLLIAESKLDGGVLGSLRLQSNGQRPLHIERQVELPIKFRESRLVEGRRLGVSNGMVGRMVMAALSKASFEVCHAVDADWFIVAGRRSVAATYRSMYFDDLLGGETVRLPHAEDLPHSVFALPVRQADERWRIAGHALYDFMARAEHPDIKVDFNKAFQALVGS